MKDYSSENYLFVEIQFFLNHICNFAVAFIQVLTHFFKMQLQSLRSQTKQTVENKHQKCEHLTRWCKVIDDKQ